MKVHKVAEAIKLYWDSDAGLTGAVTGGLWWKQPDQDAGASGAAYAVMDITEEDPNFTSGDAGWQTFNVDIVVRSSGGATAAGAIQERIDLLFNRDAKDTIQVIGATRVMDLWPRPHKLDRDQQMRDAKDMIVATASFGLMLQLDFK